MVSFTDEDSYTHIDVCLHHSVLTFLVYEKNTCAC